MYSNIVRSQYGFEKFIYHNNLCFSLPYIVYQLVTYLSDQKFPYYLRTVELNCSNLTKTLNLKRFSLREIFCILYVLISFYSTFLQLERKLLGWIQIISFNLVMFVALTYEFLVEWACARNACIVLWELDIGMDLDDHVEDDMW